MRRTARRFSHSLCKDPNTLYQAVWLAADRPRRARWAHQAQGRSPCVCPHACTAHIQVPEMSCRSRPACLSGRQPRECIQGPPCLHSSATPALSTVSACKSVSTITYHSCSFIHSRVSQSMMHVACGTSTKPVRCWSACTVHDRRRVYVCRACYTVRPHTYESLRTLGRRRAMLAAACLSLWK